MNDDEMTQEEKDLSWIGFLLEHDDPLDEIATKRMAEVEAHRSALSADLAGYNEDGWPVSHDGTLRMFW